MATNYIAAVGTNWPTCFCHALGDPTVYSNLVYDSGTAIPSQATIDAWVTANPDAVAASESIQPGAMEATSANPLDPASAPGEVVPFAGNFAGKLQFGYLDPDGIANYVQNALYRNFSFMWMPGPSAGLSISWGAVCTEVLSGTGAGKSVPTLTSTNVVTQMKRLLLSTGTTTTGSDGIVTNSTVCWRGNAAGRGGFLFFARFATETYLASERLFVGLSANSAALAADPTGLFNSIGIAKNSADSTLQIIQVNGSTATKTNTGITPSSSQVLDLVMYCKPNDTKVTVLVMDAVTGAVLVNNLVLNTTLPVNTVFLRPQALIQSTAGTTSKQLSVAKIYVETEL